MKLAGRITVGQTPTEIAQDTKRVARIRMSQDGNVAKGSMYLDGLGSGGVGPQVCRQVVYDLADNLVALSDEVVVLVGQEPGWTDFPYSGYGGKLALTAGDYQLGILAGAYTNTIRVYGDVSRGALTSELPLTVSGNEITDATRSAVLTAASAGQMMDGLVNDSSFGIFRAATNLFRHGQCDSVADLTGANAAGITFATDATVPPPFSTQSIKVTVDGTAANQGGQSISAVGQAAAAGVVAVGSIYFKGTAGQSYACTLRWGNTDATTTVGIGPTFVATGAWQLITPNSLAVAAGKTGDQLRIAIYVNGTRAESFWMAHAMLEKGQAVVAPYVATSGGVTATHAASSVSAPGSLLTTAQGWVAAKLRMGYSNAIANFPASKYVFELEAAGNSNERIVGNINGGSIQLFSISGGSTANQNVLVAPAYNAGDLCTFIAFWTATTLYVSWNGSAFHAIPRTLTPLGVLSTLTIGRNPDSANQFIDSDVLWFACGTGTLVDSDAAMIAAFASDPGFGDLPGDPTMLWTADTANYVTAQSGKWNPDTYSDGPSSAFGSATPVAHDMSSFLLYFAPYADVIPTESALYFSRLPFETAQYVLGLGGPDDASKRLATVGWHYTSVDSEQGSVALVRDGSDFADLVGERVRVETLGISARSVYAFVRAVGPDDLEWDLSLSRMLYGRLALLSDDPFTAAVSLIGEPT